MRGESVPGGFTRRSLLVADGFVGGAAADSRIFSTTTWCAWPALVAPVKFAAATCSLRASVSKRGSLSHPRGEKGLVKANAFATGSATRHGTRRRATMRPPHVKADARLKSGERVKDLGISKKQNFKLKTERGKFEVHRVQFSVPLGLF